MEDGANKIFLSAEGTQHDISDELQAFLQYVAGKAPSTEITRKLDHLVNEAREHKEWRMEYMTLLERDEMMREEGRAEERENTLREKQRADSAEQRADSLEEEIAILKEQLAALKK